MWIHKAALALLAAACLFLSACSSLSVTADVEQLMRPPTLSAEQEQVRDALEASIGTDQYRLKYPTSGQYRSAYTFYDLDGDGQEEAVVFYALDEDSSGVVRIAVLDSQNGQWRAVVSAAGQGTDVDQLQFASVTGSQAVDLVVGWIDETRTYETVTVYTFRQERLQNLYEDSYTELLVDDLDQDGMDELLLLRSSSGGRVTAKLVENSLFSLEITDERRLNLSFANILQVQSGWLSQEVYGVAVDGYTSDYRYSSEAIVARDGQLAFPFDREGDSDDLYDLVTRSSRVFTRDVDGDGVLDFPSQEALPGYESSDPEDTLFLTRYLHFNGEGSLETAASAYVDAANGYLLFFPDNWLGEVTAVVQPQSGEVTFFQYLGSLEDQSAMLLRIRCYSSSDYQDQNDREQYVKLVSRGIFEYYASIHTIPGNPLSITLDHLSQEMFALL